MSLPFQLALGNNTPTNVSTTQGRITMSDTQYLSLAGGSPGQVLTTDGAGHVFWAAVTASGSDAPSDGTVYGRFNGTWAQVLPLAGPIDAGVY